MIEQQTIHRWKARTKKSLWEERICAELDFLVQIFSAQGKPVPEDLQSVLQTLAQLSEQQVLSQARVLEAEATLAAYAPLAKQYEVFCVSHAHIDMNWMWGMPETVGVVIDTFQTMLNLLDEYPDFIFSQSQASTYRIIEQYAPSMLPAIRERIAQGRWEVTASSWVENDKNMSGSESMVRHLLYTKRYLHRLLGIDPASLCIDFEPDTFGHSANMPEFLQKGGVRYYFHCRGNDREEVSRWRAPSGAEVLCYREPNWYLGPIESTRFSYVPAFCHRNHTSCAAVVYGVGDHGGGPTRRDIERLLDMQHWPLMPKLHFSRLIDFFDALSNDLQNFPIVERELNCVFTGCYTSQSRIKQANRRLEDTLYDSEALCAMQKLSGCPPVEYAPFENAWEITLFNQFHDILPGSCVPDTVRYALGKAQEALGYAIANANRAMKAIGSSIDTSRCGCADLSGDTAEGAGCGYNTMRTGLEGRQAASDGWKITETCHGGGTVRAYTVFNTTQYDRTELISLTIWDWQIPLNETALLSGDGERIAFTVREQDQAYWQHRFHKIKFLATVPAFGYANYYLRESQDDVCWKKRDEPRVHRDEDGSLVLENDLVRAEFSTQTMQLLSLKDKSSNTEFLSPSAPSAGFRLALEQTSEEYSAWIIGQYRKITDLNETCFVDICEQSFDERDPFIRYRMQFGSSALLVHVQLHAHSRVLRFSVDLDWRKLGAADRDDHATPQLHFHVPVGYHIREALCDIPGGTTLRRPAGHDVPAILYAAGLSDTQRGCLMLTSDSKYGYRISEDAMQLSLIRSSFAPDRLPDFGEHHWELGVGIMPEQDAAAMLREAVCFAHPLYAYSNSIHTGDPEQRKSLLSANGSVVQTLKPSEDNAGIVLRLRNDTQEQTRASICLNARIQLAQQTDLFEAPQRDFSTQNGEFSADLEPHSVKTVKIIC